MKKNSIALLLILILFASSKGDLNQLEGSKLCQDLCVNSLLQNRV
jgi:hypothetical protein